MLIQEKVESRLATVRKLLAVTIYLGVLSSRTNIQISITFYTRMTKRVTRCKFITINTCTYDGTISSESTVDLPYSNS